MTTSQQTDPLIGRLVDDRYRVRARIARGGMATVYVATDLRLERRVALKVMHGHLSDDAVFQGRFIQEARSAARLADPHVVNVFDQGQDEGIAYLVMEYLPGITLRELLREQKRLDVAQTITIMDATLSGLAAAHRAGIVHRDVKPENILLAEDGRIKIGDFGLARATTANTATGQMLLGTIAYLAPELVTRGTADARSDIYALGIMLYEMLVGDQPYKGEQPMQIAYRHATDTVPRPSVKNAQVPEQLDELVLWATEKEPDDRPRDAQVMLERLREIERDLGIAPTPARANAGVSAAGDGGSGDLTKVLPAAPPTGGVTTNVEIDNAARLRTRTRRRRARGVWAALLVLLLAAAAGGLGWFFGSGPGSLVAVADVSGMTFDAAAERLAEDSLIATEGEGRHSLDVEPGLVLFTEPAAGERIDQDAEVAVVLSLGPQPHTLEPLVGTPENTARQVLADLNLQVGESATEFSDESAGTVLSARLEPRDGGDAVNISDGGEVLEGDTVVLTVSLGPVPGVRGMGVGDATATLEAVDLRVADSRAEEYSDELAEGQVLGIRGQPEGRNWRPGDEATLIVSLGPEPFPIPDVIDLTRDEARTTLEDAGFTVDFAPFWNAVPDALTRVTGTDPEPGAARVLGTSVYLQLTASG
ncbi:Stk1 family PASTA domain-containing Ser/Thr kinase [Microbacterium sp. LRZ72]|uniref:Stk1 family PASTA domain-containing Ser/Thr kinase n=1 Tax=Microbacterium sp. LRZ72 TaxID=2942481 RepID=UPI0029BC7A1B|nr:Stk1 family PASTA domain-containing Ser/Thr kinase [Microbacterium sp. LRZ72]MDX2377159.1 Stk1 family PASTA domain-containing Ser/Thr kinase [Microbacterium sp. LRZ72]